MNYYEELGLSREAAEKEIRRSYKRLAVLFHPDQQRDPETRVLAETQMKRLNEMIGILADPGRRRLYDEGLRSNERKAIQAVWMQARIRILNNRGWVLVGLGSVALLGLAAFISGGGPGHVSSSGQEQPAKPAQSKQEVASDHVERREQPKASPLATRSRPKNPKCFDDPGTESALDHPPLHEAPAPARPEMAQRSAPLASVEAGLDGPAGTRPPPSGAMGISPAEPSLAGRWVYTPDPGESYSAKLFPADYVELTIRIAGGVMHGAYRSRYRVLDRATSPAVNFTFEGPAIASSFPWQSDSGATGEITLKMNRGDTLHASWFASAMGPTLSLGSGTATLYRFR